MQAQIQQQSQLVAQQANGIKQQATDPTGVQQMPK